MRALALNTSPELNEAVTFALCEGLSSPARTEHMLASGSSVLEEAHLSVLVSELDLSFSPQQHDFLVIAGILGII